MDFEFSLLAYCKLCYCIDIVFGLSWLNRKEKQKLDYHCVGFNFVRTAAVALYVGCVVVLQSFIYFSFV